MRRTQPLMRRVRAWLPALAWAGFIFLFSAQPYDAFPDLGIWLEILSVGGHLFMYAVLMALLVMALRRGSGLPARRVWLVALLLAALYGLSDEYHQSFVPGRTATPLDWATDVTGAALSWWALLRWDRRRGR